MHTPRTIQPDEFKPSHVKALSRAVREASWWRGQLEDPQARVAFDAYIREAKAALKVVRELARQQKSARKYRG